MRNFLRMIDRWTDFILAHGLLFLVVLTPIQVWSSGHVPQKNVSTNAVTDTHNSVEATRINNNGNNKTGLITENIRNRFNSFQSHAAGPSQNRKTKTRKNPGKSPSPSLKNKGDDVQVWYGPKGYAPRQIKLRTAAKKQGKVLMEAITGNFSRRDRDERTSRSFLRTNRAFLHIHYPDDELILSRYKEDKLKKRHLRYQQKYKGIPIWLAEINVHLDENGNVELLNSSHVPTPKKLVTKPVISSKRALELARDTVRFGDRGIATDPELIIFTESGSGLRLAWKIELSISIDVYWLAIIDAHRGTVLSAFNQVNTSIADGSGTGLLGVVRPLKLWSESSKYYLVDSSKIMFDNGSDPPAINTTKGAIIVSDMTNTELPNQGNPFNYQEITSTAATSGWLADGVSLSYSLSQTYDYYNELHGRTSLDGKNSSILGFVRVGTNFNNAFWTTEYNAMFFGDGKDYAAALDVVAHELTHGITSFTCNLIYKDQSGALNEAFSDIFGEMVEARTDGNTDWINGTALNDGGRNLADPGSGEILTGSGDYYPAKMSEFYGRDSALLQQLVNQDNGGVHINCTIISHAFYLLAEGMTGAIGNTDAAKIFYRAQTTHLLAGSQFIDARLACVTSAEELFGMASAQAQKTAEAFDAIEVFVNAETPVPPPVTPVAGEDSAVFISYFDHPDYGGHYLASYESAQANWLSWNPVGLTRPSVSGDGSVAFFVNSFNDACWIDTIPSATVAEDCLGAEGAISSVAMSPDQQVYGFVLLDDYGDPTNEITVVDLRPGGVDRTFVLSAPGTEDESLNTVLFADAMDFTSDNRYLIYDAFNVFTMPDNTQIGTWSIYALDLETEQIIGLTDPVKDLEVGYPAVSQTTNHRITFDVFDDIALESTVTTMDLLSGKSAAIATINNDWGVPGFNGDDSAIIYEQPDASTLSGYSLYQKDLEDDGITPSPSPATAVFPTGGYGAGFGVVFRRGTYSVPLPDISISPETLSFETVTIGASSIKSVTITNNGTSDLTINSTSLSGTNAAEFMISGGCSGQILPASGTCTLDIKFTPTAEGAKTATLSIRSDDPDSSDVTVSLTGNGETVAMCGDVSGDMSVDLKDLMMVLQFLAGINTNVSLNGDCYNDSKIEMREALTILNKLSGGGVNPPETNETEPNNSPQESQHLGSLEIGSSLAFSGTVSSGGFSGDTYTGDLDYFTITLPRQANISFQMDWSGTADVDFAIGTENFILETVMGSEKPIQLAGTLSQETFYILIASKDSPADYQLQLSASPSTAEYANDNSLLSGDYYETGTSLLYWYSFDGGNGYQSWQWNPASGNYLNHSGTYSVWYPYLILTHTDGKVEVFDLQIISANRISLNGVFHNK